MKKFCWPIFFSLQTGANLFFRIYREQDFFGGKYEYFGGKLFFFDVYTQYEYLVCGTVLSVSCIILFLPQFTSI